MAQQQIYYYDSQTFIYLRSDFIDGQLPANSTLVAPGAPALHSSYVWNQNTQEWVATPDFRGVAIFSQTDGTVSSMNSIGAIASGYTDVPPPDYPAVYPTAYSWSNGAWVVNETKNTAAVAATVRAKRNLLLASSDFIEGQDVPCTAACLQAFSTYRQYLRDMPQTQAGWPSTPTWPNKPSYTRQSTLDAIAAKQTAVAAGYTSAVNNPIA